MTSVAFTLVIAAAVLHALWNFWAKRTSGGIGVFWLGLCFAGLTLAPVAVLTDLSTWTARGLSCVVATGLLHAVYFGLLTAAHEHGEMSVVYPLSRGTGVLGTALLGWVALGEQIAELGAVGLLLVSTGILVLLLKTTRPHGGYRPYVLAVFVGVTITAYSIVDKFGVGSVNPVAYIVGLAVVTAISLAPYALLARREQCRNAWRCRKGQSFLVGLAAMGTYLLILFAFQQAPASYVVAVRECSIVVVAALSVAILKEPMTILKGVSVAAILVGVVVIRLA